MFDTQNRNQEIRRRFLDGETLQSLGNSFNISRQRVHQIVAGLERVTRRPRKHAPDVTVTCVCGKMFNTRMWDKTPARKFCTQACSALGNRKPRTSEAVALRLGGMSYREVAAKLGYKSVPACVNSVRRRMISDGTWVSKPRHGATP